jgi:Flp pilus assembly protein TadG
MRKLKLPYAQKSPAQAMVEFALVLPVLLLIIYGLFEVGRLLFIYNSVVSAARQATRYGAATGLNTDGGVPRYQDCTGMRSAAQRSGFIDKFEDADITIWHDDGEDKNQVVYCAPGVKSDRSFHPSAGNVSRVRVEVTTEYTPIVPFIPMQPLTITSVSARTILVGVSIAITGGPQDFGPEATEAPTSEIPATATPVTGRGSRAATAAAACDVRHSVLKTSPFGMTIFNYSAAVTIHITNAEIWPPPSPAGQTLNRLTLGGAAIWMGNLPSESPTDLSPLLGNVSIGPHANKFLQVGFSTNYQPNGLEKIVISFAENECPALDSSNTSQLP